MQTNLKKKLDEIDAGIRQWHAYDPSTHVKFSDFELYELRGRVSELWLAFCDLQPEDNSAASYLYGRAQALMRLTVEARRRRGYARNSRNDNALATSSAR